MIEPIADYRTFIGNTSHATKIAHACSGFRIENADYAKLCEITRVVDVVISDSATKFNLPKWAIISIRQHVSAPLPMQANDRTSSSVERTVDL